MRNRSSTADRFAARSTRNRRLLRQEELILEATELLSAALERGGISRTELASRLGKSRGFVSQVLAGGRNLTLRTLSDIADALDGRVRLSLEPIRRVNKTRAAAAREVVSHSRNGASQTDSGRS